jgi:hypothetical protein
MNSYERWITAEKVVFGFSCLASLGDVSPAKLYNTDVWLSQEAMRLGSGDPALFSIAWQRASSAVDLDTLLKSGFTAPSYWQNAIAHTAEQRARPSITTYFLAQQIIAGTASADALVELIRRLFRLRSSTDYHSMADPLHAALSVVRSTSASIAEKIDGVNTLISEWSAPKYLERARGGDVQLKLLDIAHGLFTPLHAWPLLLINDTPISLPVAVEVEWPGSEGSAGRAEVRFVPQHTEWIDASKFSRPLVRAAEAAKKLWRSKHGSAGVFRDLVADASFRVDISAASLICEGLVPVSLEKRSAEIYFSQIMLSRLLGKPGAHATAITGLIGSQRTWFNRNTGRKEKLLDYEILPAEAEGTRLKMHLVIRQRRHERFVVPDFPENELVELERAGTEVITGCRYLQHVTDCAQPEGWRHHRFVHCPELARTALRKHDKEMRVDASVENFLQTLKANTACVLHADNVSEETVVAALAHINGVLREHLGAGPWRQPPAMATYTFIRCVEDQVYDPFWMVLWSAIGGSQTSLSKFLLASSPEESAAVLDGELNRVGPTIDQPSAHAPDVLVILDSRRLEDAAAIPTFPGAIHRRAVLPILEKLRLDSNHLRALVGRTRVIVVRGCIPQIIFPIGDDSDSAHLLRVLSGLRWGFNLPMLACIARRLMPRANLRPWLKDQIAGGRLLETTDGFFYIPEPIRPGLLQSVPTGKLSEMHFSCGFAYAPYLDPHSIAGLSIDRALTPSNVLEARYHFVMCSRAAIGIRSTYVARIANDARRLATWLIRYALPDCWWKIDELTRAGLSDKHVVALAEALLAREDRPSAQTLFEVASAYYRLDADAAIGTRSRGCDLYSQAFEAAFASLNSDADRQREAFVLHIGAYWSLFLSAAQTGKELPSETIASRVQWLDALITERLAGGADGRAVRGLWYEKIGDEENADFDASVKFLMGLSYVNDYGQLWVKAAGALHLADIQRTTTVEQWKTFRDLLHKRIAEDGGDNYFAGVFTWADTPKARRIASEDTRFQCGISVLAAEVACANASLRQELLAS